MVQRVEDQTTYVPAEPAVHGATQASGFDAGEVFDVDRGAALGEGVLDRPTGGGPGEALAEVADAVAHPLVLDRVNLALAGLTLVVAAFQFPVVGVPAGPAPPRQ